MVHFVFLWCVVFDFHSSIADSTLNHTSLIFFFSAFRHKILGNSYFSICSCLMFKLYVSYLSFCFLNLSCQLASVTVKIVVFTWEIILRFPPFFFFLINTVLEFLVLLKPFCCFFNLHCKLRYFLSLSSFPSLFSCRIGHRYVNFKSF